MTVTNMDNIPSPVLFLINFRKYLYQAVCATGHEISVVEYKAAHAIGIGTNFSLSNGSDLNLEIIPRVGILYLVLA